MTAHAEVLTHGVARRYGLSGACLERLWRGADGGYDPQAAPPLLPAKRPIRFCRFARGP